MEDKHTATVVLGIVVILAIIGLVLMLKTANTGDVMLQGSRTYANTKGNPFPYYDDTYHTAGYQDRMTTQHDWSWRTEPEHTYGAKMGVCAILATPEIGKAPAGYIWDADFQESQGKDCVKITDSQKGWCCKPPSQ